MISVNIRIKNFRWGNVLTFLNATAGIFSIFLSISREFTLAVIFMLAAAAFDFFDGKLARLTKTSSEFGRELDSLADIVSFGAAPVVFGFMLLQQAINTFAVISFSFFLLCGMFRLARYNVTRVPYYEGLPIPESTVVIALLYLFKFPVQYLPYAYILLGLLMISRFKVKKAI